MVTQLAMPTTARIPVEVRADDQILRAGLLSQLRHRHEVRLLRDGEDSDGAVVVIVTDQVDDETLRTIRVARRGGSARVVLVAARLDDATLVAAVEAGAGSLVLRGGARIDAIIEAIQCTWRGSGSMPPELLGRLLNQVGRLQRDVLGPRGLNFSCLTDRETKVLSLIAEGYDTVEVGRRLFYSDRTVKTIVHDITSRLNLRNRTHAVAYAVRQGLI